MSAPSAPEFERTPPQNIDAEMSVLGGMLLSKDAIADVVEVLRPGDFYRPAHQTIYDAILDLYGKGDPADAVSVMAELTRRGELQRTGGGPYLHSLTAMVPTAANAGYYAKIVAEQAILRRLVEAGTRIVQLGYAGRGGDVDDIVDRAQQAVFDVTERRTGEDFIQLESLLTPTLEEIERIGDHDGGLTGVPTGFADLDELTNGLHPGQLVIIAARPAIGKALALDTPLPTPTGWTTMGEVHVGDELLGSDGRSTRVIAATDVLVDRPCYELEFSDGTRVVADAQHQWLTDTRASRRSPNVSAAVRTTEEIARAVRCPTADARVNHSVRLAAPLQRPTAPLPLSPYALGVWLGDGHSAGSRITTADAEIVMRLEGEGLPDDDTVTALLRKLGVLNNKHIPLSYLRASEAQRRDLLAGLLDTDGTVTPTGSVQFAVTSKALADSVYELVMTLGYRCGRSTKRVRGRTEKSSTCYTLTFTTDDDVFRLERKRLAHKERRRAPHARGTRYIRSVRPVASVPVRCVQVDSRDRLFLATRSFVPTHNSTLALDAARAAAIRHQQAAVIFSLEMTRNEITMRLLSAEARVHLQRMRTGKMAGDDWDKLARRMGEIAHAPLFIDDSPNLNMVEIRAKARRLKQRHDLKLIVVDYMQLMTSPRRVENRQQEVSEISRSLKLLAKELDVPVIAVSQLNRNPEARADKRPQLSDLRESGAIEMDADIVIMLHREDAYERESPRAGEADFIIAKHRNGPTGVITVAFQGHYSRFVDMVKGN
ncbi:MAG: replicative DNA helicase [Frankia sp.]|nr:replicative DNA helicase [Frankia sp.]